LLPTNRRRSLAQSDRSTGFLPCLLAFSGIVWFGIGIAECQGVNNAMLTPLPAKTKESVSIVIPMCNEEESIEILREKLALLQNRLDPDFEVEYCLVDDGSTDSTWALMGSAIPEKASFVRRKHVGNRGVGAAIRTGLAASSGSIVCTLDADCSYPPEDLYSLIQRIVSCEADIAVASPYHPAGSVVGVGKWRVVLSRQCSRLYQWLSPLKLYTYTSIFRAYSGEAARQLTFASDGFVSAAEMLFNAHGRGFSVCEVPLVLRARQRGYSKIRILRTITAHLALMVQLVRSSAAHSQRADVSGRSRILSAAPKHLSPMGVPARLGDEDASIS
jgi:dolichol-phosphate mannosyltransferase